MLTISVNSTQGDQDDALRLELTNTSADPTTRGWNDYTFLTAGATAGTTASTAANDTVPNP